MPDYCFYTQGKQTIALARSDMNRASELLAQGFIKEAEEVRAPDEKQAAARFADIRKENAIDQKTAGRRPDAIGHSIITGSCARR